MAQQACTRAEEIQAFLLGRLSQEQADELFAAFRMWRRSYWQPWQMNREFASHFHNPNSWVRLFRDIRMAWRRFLGLSKPIDLRAGELSPVTAK